MPQVTEPLCVLLLPARLEEFVLADHARALLDIPRVLALEPGRFRTPRVLRQSAAAHTAKRLRLPGDPRVLVLYHPRQYLLARAMCARYQQAELWYVLPDPSELDPEAEELDLLSRERATPARMLSREEPPEPLRQRLRELEIVSSRPFVPGARIVDR